MTNDQGAEHGHRGDAGDAHDRPGHGAGAVARAARTVGARAADLAALAGAAARGARTGVIEEWAAILGEDRPEQDEAELDGVHPDSAETIAVTAVGANKISVARGGLFAIEQAVRPEQGPFHGHGELEHADTEPIIGWRSWDMQLSGLLEASGNQTVWTPRERNEAQCLSYSSDPEHHAPVESCSCGFYAYRDRDTLIREGLEHRSVPLFGPVRLWGRVIVGERGYRAQYAYPGDTLTALLPPAEEYHETARRRARRVETIYGVAVEILHPDDFYDAEAASIATRATLSEEPAP